VNVTSKNAFLTSVVATAIMASAVATAADAIDVKNVADPVRHPYQQTANFNCGPQPIGCLLAFPAITTARTVVLHASCNISLVDSQIIVSVYLSDSTLQIPSYLPITKFSDSGSESSYAAVSDPYAFFETGQQPTVNVSVAGPPSAVFVGCTLTGYYL
jgi:hypothetical protein